MVLVKTLVPSMSLAIAVELEPDTLCMMDLEVIDERCDTTKCMKRAGTSSVSVHHMSCLSGAYIYILA